MTSKHRRELELKVYLVPVGATRHELYCEADDGMGMRDNDTPSRGVFRGLYARFHETLAETQEARRGCRLGTEPPHPSNRQPRAGRLRNWIISWVTEIIVEQRLLWRLRTQHEAALVHPDDLNGSRALQILRGQLQRDADHHRRWFIVDGAGAAALGPLLFFVPGPNLIAYYFTFRAVAHFLSWRGALQGAIRIAWRTYESGPLTDLRGAISLEPDELSRHVWEVEARLGLEHLSAFVERMVVRAR